MTIRDDLLSFRREQVDNDHRLLPLSLTLLPAAAQRLEQIKTELLTSPEHADELMHEGENITECLADIRDIRGWLVFSLAWSGHGKQADMTTDEWECYQIMQKMGAMLRGEA